jgi:hypothetical protein
MQSQSATGQIAGFNRVFLVKKAQKAGKIVKITIKKNDSAFKNANFTNRKVGCIVEA